jgi:hypothetical protein
LVNNLKVNEQLGHLVVKGASPTILTYTGPGSLTNATDMAGTITLTIPALTNPQTLAFITFAEIYDVAPVILLTAADQRTGINELGISVQSGTQGFEINSGNSSAGVQVTYNWYYFIIQSSN